MRSFILDSKIDKAFQMQQVICELRTVSQIIRKHNIQQIDLLKVDVERSELDVILGIPIPSSRFNIISAIAVNPCLQLTGCQSLVSFRCYLSPVTLVVKCFRR